VAEVTFTPNPTVPSSNNPDVALGSSNPLITIGELAAVGVPVVVDTDTTENDTYNAQPPINSDPNEPG
jgi:hypothetical protein